MRTSSIFAATNEEIDRLIDAHPLALLVSLGEDGFCATPLPLLIERSGRHVELLGHFARSNPQIEALERSPDALAVFMGPHGYISPSWFTDRTQAPTWNFATVHMQVRVHIDRSIEAARRAVDRLTEKMEVGRPLAWSACDMGERYERLLPGVVAFRAEVLHTASKFKLGQNERLDVLSDALAGLADEPAISLDAMMREANCARLGTVEAP